jgi:hypothetical protein
MIVLSLLLVILLAVYNFFDHSQKIYIRTETLNILQDYVNRAMQYLADDIRSAAKPDHYTRPILVYKDEELATAGDRMDIFDNKGNVFYKISYIYSENTLKRGVAQEDSAESIKSASVVYETILEGVQYPDGGELFTDITVEEDDEVNDRRHIEINLLVKDPHNRIPTVYSYLFSYTSRTKGTP